MDAVGGKYGKSTGRKRTRVPLACDICRERKVRCDGVKPACGNCIRRGVESSQCVYSMADDSGRKKSQREYVRSLHERIHHLENAQRGSNGEYSGSLEEDTGQRLVQLSPERQSLDQVSSPADPHMTGTEDSRALETSGPVPDGMALSTRRPPLSGDPAPTYHDRMTETGPTNRSSSNLDGGSAVNAMGAMCAVTTSPQSPSDSVYGPSSIVSLTTQLQQDNARSATQKSTANTAITQIPPSQPWRKTRHFSLPTRSRADHLLDQYWRNFHLFYPWIHFPSFLKAYESLWARDGADNNSIEASKTGLGGAGSSTEIFHCALNVIFALGCEFSGDTDQGVDEGPTTEFMKRADELFSITLLDQDGLSVVQTLLLLSMYLQSTQSPQQCWGMTGMALRMAHSIGLHIEDSPSLYNTLELEMRRRVWHGCVLMERIVSISLGRSPMLSHGPTVPMFSAVDDEYIEATTEPCIQPPSQFSRVSFAISMCRLGEILGEIQDSLYISSNARRSRQPVTTDLTESSVSLDAVLRLEDSLHDFENTLPEQHSAGQIEPSTMSPFARQRLSLQTKLLHAKIMLYRCGLTGGPLLEGPNIVSPERARQVLRSNSVRNSTRSLFYRDFATKCFESAGELIEVLHQATLGNYYGAWWYGVFYLMTACTVLLATYRTEIVHEERLATLWALADDILRALQEKHPMAAQCAAALRDFRNQTETSQRSESVTADTVTRTDRAVAPQQKDPSMPQTFLHRTSAEEHDPGWTARPPTHGLWNDPEYESNQYIRPDQHSLWPLFQDLQGAFADATQGNGSWKPFDQSWYWTPL